jgi:hypothetical protein
MDALRGGCSGDEEENVKLSWWEWALFRLAVLLITAPAVVVAVYLIFRKRRP